MGKVRKGTKASKHIDFESDNEELRDDVDKFHDKARKLGKNAYKKGKKKDVEEVLNVEGDLSDDSFDDGNDSSDFDEEENKGALSNKWGRKRTDFYGTDYVDEDWGGMREEEMEAAELEEVDALGRQKALDKTTSILADLFVDDDQQEKEENAKVIKETPFEWTYSNVKKLNKNTAELCAEYERRKELMSVIVEPLSPVVKALPQESALRRQLLMCFDVYSSYLMNILMYLKLKADSLAQKKQTDSLLDVHPVLVEISRLKKMIEKVDLFLEENSKVINIVSKYVEDGEDVAELDLPSISLPKKKKDVVERAEQIATEEFEEPSEEVGNGKRLASKMVAENKQMQKTSKKKKNRHAKVANRNKYNQIAKKVKSQIGVMRKETDKYSGESRGIRAATIKSTKLLA